MAAVPAQQRVGKHWYLGSADAIYQCLNIIEDERPDIVVVVGADHVYRMDFSQMVDAHIASGAEFTVAAIRQPIEEADQFGVIEIDPHGPHAHQGVPREADRPGRAWRTPPARSSRRWATTWPNADALVAAVTADAENVNSRHDMGGDIAPYFVERGTAGVYDFLRNDVPGSTPRDRDYWRDVGTIDAFYEANIDLISIEPVFNLYNDEWPLYSGYTSLAPAKFVHAGAGRLGHAADSIVSPGVLVSGATVSRLGPVPRRPAALLGAGHGLGALRRRRRSSRYAQVHRAIVDKNVVVPERVRIGLDHEHDRARGFTVTESGITVVPKGTVIERSDADR